jgi:hypothetical protein
LKTLEKTGAPERVRTSDHLFGGQMVKNLETGKDEAGWQDEPVEPAYNFCQ